MELVRRYRKLIILTVILVVVIVASWLVYDSLVFRLKGTTPKNGSTPPASLQQVEFVFNKKIKDDGVIDRIVLLVNGENPIDIVRGDSRIEDNKIIIEIIRLNQDVQYEFTVTDITAENGKKIDKVALTFSPTYVPFNELSKEQQAASIADVEDPVTEDPMFAIAPYRTIDYSIDYIELEQTEENPDGEPARPPKNIQIHVFMSNADYSDEKKVVSERRQQAINYLRSKGIDTDNYTITYTQDPDLSPNVSR